MIKNMTIRILIFLFTFLCVPIAYAAEEVTVTNVQGSAAIIRNGQSLPVANGQNIQKDDILKTEKGGVIDIEMNGLAGCRILEASQSKIVSTKEEAMVLRIENGKIVVNLEKLPKSSTFKLESPTAVAAVRGTQFFGNVDLNLATSSNTTFAVREGSIDVVTIATGQAFTVNEGFAMDIPRDFTSGNLAPREALGVEMATLDQASTVRTCG